MKKKREMYKSLVSVVMAAALGATLFPGTAFQVEKAEAADVTLSNPRIEKDDSTSTGEKVTWDCVWFGRYPQAEVVPSGNYTAVDAKLLQEGDIIVSDDTYNALRSAEEWDEHNEITLNGEKYRRMRQGDAEEVEKWPDYYQWSDNVTYHYFKYEPIKWRVLHTDGGQAFLLSDEVLDCQRFDHDFMYVAEDGEYRQVEWDNSTMRSWLNGYGADSNHCSVDFSKNNFKGYAFSNAEQGAILDSTLDNTPLESWMDAGKDTVDKIFLLSEAEVHGTEQAVSYGFSMSGSSREDRCTKSTTYAKAMGISSRIYDNYNFKNIAYSGWWLRSPGASIPASHIYYGMVLNYTDDMVPETEGVRVALRLDLSASELYRYAGTAESSHTTESPKPQEPELKVDGKYKYRYDSEDDTVEIVEYTGEEEILVLPSEIDGSIVTGINGAFSGCSTLVKVTIPEGVRYLGDYAFCDCNSLKEIKIPESMEVIGTSALKNSLEQVIIPKGVAFIASNAFNKYSPINLFLYGPCPFEDGLAIGEGSTLYVLEENWDSYAEVRDENKSVNWIKWDGTLPDSGTSVKDPTKLPDQEKSSMLSVGETVKDKGTGALYKVTAKGEVAYVRPLNANRTSVKVPKQIVLEGYTFKVTSVSANAFKGNKKLKSVTLGNNVTTIGAKAFSKCTALTKITVPASVRKIGKQAFYGCKKLKSITIKTKKLTAKKVGSKAFKGIYTKAVIKVPKGNLKSYKKILKAKGAGGKVKIK